LHDSHLDSDEKAVLDHLADAWNSFVKLQSVHPEEQSDFRFSIHAAQAIVMARPAQRQENRSDP
jgi:hypothetical protein